MTVRHCWPLTSNTLAGRWLSPQYAKADLSRWSLLCREEQSAASYVGTQTSLLHQRKKLEAETRADPDSDLLWSVPTARSDRAYNWGQSSIARDAVGQMTAQDLQIPFYFEYELRARHPRGVIARLDPYESYYWSPEHEDDQPPYPVTLFVVDTEEVEDTYVSTAALMSRMSLPIFVSCQAVLSHTGILGRSWRPLWEPELIGVNYICRCASIILAGCPLLKTLLSCTGPIAGDVELQDDRVMDDPVYGRCRGHRVGEDLVPL